MKAWVVAQLGAREHYMVAAELESRGRLRALLTDYWSRIAWSPSIGPPAVRAPFQRRSDAIPSHKVLSCNTATVLRRLLPSRGGMWDRWIAGGRWFGRQSVRRLESLLRSGPVDVFFGYNTASLEVLQFARSAGLYCIVDQVDPGRIEHRIVEEERRTFPHWEPHVSAAPAAYHERHDEEWRLADLVVVNSEWSRESLLAQGVPHDKLLVVPLTFRPGRIVLKPVTRTPGPLHVLWVGTVMLRKGIQYLVQAAERLQHRRVHFTVVGEVLIAPEVVRRFPRNMTVMGRVARREVQRVYGDADVFVLPTLSDGFALTQLEAMAHGLPVIATERCGSVVRDGENGIRVPLRCADALADAIASLDDDRALLAALSERARQTALEFAEGQFQRAFDALVDRAEGSC